MTDWQYRSFCIQIGKRGYRTKEPEPIEREESVVWRKVFGELWGDKLTKADVAADLSIPLEEIENLIFGLVGPSQPPVAMPDKHGKKPSLTVVKG